MEQHIHNTNARDLDAELCCGSAVALRFVVDATHGELEVLACNIHNCGGKTCNICRADAYGDAESTLGTIPPARLHNAVGIALAHTAGIRAVAAVDGDAGVDSHKAEDIITLDAELSSDLGINSIELADLVMICEEKFDLVIEDEDLNGFITVGDVVNYLESRD